MGEATRMLTAMERGDLRSAEELLPVIYDELRQLAARPLALEKPGQTLQATVLVHEAWLRLVGTERRHGKSSRHFYGAAARAMRRLLIENARRKQFLKRGGRFVTLDPGARGGRRLWRVPPVEFHENTAS